jgi:hypothetical protein
MPDEAQTDRFTAVLGPGRGTDERLRVAVELTDLERARDLVPLFADLGDDIVGAHVTLHRRARAHAIEIVYGRFVIPDDDPTDSDLDEVGFTALVSEATGALIAMVSIDSEGEVVLLRPDGWSGRS